MKINTLFWQLVGKSSHFCVKQLGTRINFARFLPELLNTLARDYEVVVVV